MDQTNKILKFKKPKGKIGKNKKFFKLKLR